MREGKITTDRAQAIVAENYDAGIRGYTYFETE